MGLKCEFEFKNLPKEGPPSTDIPVNPNISFMTALSNFCVANGKELNMKYSSTGVVHMPMWTSKCTIDGKEYGTACAFTRKAADKEAARQTLDLLDQENLHLASSRKYYPIFVDYLRVHGLEDRIEFVSTADGPDHNHSWTCIVYLDGIEIGQGSSSTKKYAMEKASVSAASLWPSTKRP
ncbi:hypothetical protein ACEPAI_1661 [Sanghuangporus weigelae]